MCCVVLQGWCFYFTKRQTNEMCAIFILYFVLFLFVTCFGWNFSAIAMVVVVVAAAGDGGGGVSVGSVGGGWREEEVSLGVIITKTEIKFHIFLSTLH